MRQANTSRRRGAHRGSSGAPKPTAIDLFSGCGGVTVGLKRAGFAVLGAVEMESKAADTYAANHPEVRLWRSDIRSLSPHRMMKSLKIRRGDLDLLAGCPPCQGFSALRTRNGSAKNRDCRNTLPLEMLRFIRAFRPRAVMLENVPRISGSRAFLAFCNQLKELGYQVEWRLRDAADLGVPQRRRRIVLVAGLRKSIPAAPDARPRKTVRDAIRRLPRPGRSGDVLHDLVIDHGPHVRALIRDIPKNGGSRTDLAASRQLDCHRRCDGFKDIYGRMSWDDVAPTITGGCFNPSKGRFLHPVQNRAITLREAALLQTFPIAYQFLPSHGKQSIALMIGNAFPPEATRRYALEIARVLRTDAGVAR